MLAQDLRFGLRMLRRSPGFTIVAVLILALGIGANTSIFSVVSAVLLEPLPFEEPDRLVFLWEDAISTAAVERSTVAPANYADWKARSASFEDMALFNGLASHSLTGGGEPEQLAAIRATGNLFAVVGLTPILGRTFSVDDEGADATPVVVLSQTLWARRFGGDPGVVGRTVVLDGVAHTVIGVVPPAFRYPNKDAEIYIPASFTPAELAERNNHSLWVVARLRPGVTVGEAQAEMTAVARSLADDYPDTNGNIGVTVAPLREELARGASLLGEGDIRAALLVLLGAVATILLITCANVANLLLARAGARRRELAVRQALGADRGRVLRQLLTESAVLASCGLVVGVALSAASLGYLSRLIPGTLPSGTAPALDWRVLGFMGGIALLTVLLFGAGPALAIARGDFAGAVKKRIGGAGRREPIAGNALVVGEIALTVVLLAAAGLLLRSYAGLLAVDPGFRPDRLLIAETSLSPTKYADSVARTAFYAGVLERTRALPGVESAGYVSAPPLIYLGGRLVVLPEGQPPPSQEGILRTLASVRSVSADYLETLGVPLLRGRSIHGRDTAGAPLVAVINEAMAQSHWPGVDPLGRRFRYGFPDAPWITVVGVAGNVRQMGLDAAPFPEVYVPAEQLGGPFLAPRYLVVRTQGDPLALAPAVRRAVWDVDPDQPISFRTMREVLDAQLASRSTQLTLIGGFAALALLLAATGLYGVLSYTVARRSSEIGLRMALGAQRGGVVGAVVRSALAMAVLGVLLGAAASYALSRVLTSLLLGVSATDPATFVAVAALLVLVALVASYLPARRAAGIDPAAALRME